MSKEPRCSICTDAAARVAVDELAAKGGTVRSIAGQVRCSRSSVHRHLLHSRGKAAAASKTVGSRKSSQAGRLSSGRCGACGLSIAETDPQSLLRRAERLLWIAETIATTAQRDDDARLALQAVDRARASMETMMRATGVLGGDGQVTVNLDARKLAFASLAQIPESFIRRLAAGDDAAIDAVLEASGGSGN